MQESINLSAWLGCDVKQAFSMFTNNEHVKSWLPSVANVEPRIGGKYELYRKLKSKNNKKSEKGKTTVVCKILIYEPDKYITFEWMGPADKLNGNYLQLDTQVTIYFLPMDTNREGDENFTEVHLTLTIFDDPEDDEEARIKYENSWANAFEKLIEQVNDLFQ